MTNCERAGTKSATDSRSEADDLESFVHSLSLRVEYYKSIEYRLKWKSPMYPRRSSRLPKASKKSPETNPRPDEGIIQCRPRGKRQGTVLRKSKAGDSVVKTDERGRDVIDIISNTHEEEHVAEEDEGKFVEVVYKGVDESDDDCGSSPRSIASGPSVSYNTTSSQLWCSACQQLYEKARRMKAPIKNKLLDNDPKSMTCDQWTLLKAWRPRRLPNARGKLLIHVQLVKKRLKVMKGVKQSQQYVGESSSCSRPHIFLQRNLRRCVKVPMKQERKKNRGRKRTRNDSLGSRAAKQQHLYSNTHLKYLRATCTNDKSRHPTSSHSSRSGLKDCRDKKNPYNQTDTCLPIDLGPSTVTIETTRPKQQTPKKARGFRDLLAQLHSNSSMIVRETH